MRHRDQKGKYIFEGKTITPPNPSGLCQCGCGQKAPIAANTSYKHGLIEGEPVCYLVGHHRRLSPVEYIVEPETGCWLWQRAINDRGYGKGYLDGKDIPAHRFVYERNRGPIPEGLQLDHLCRNRRCVNPNHLEPVTQKENVRRGLATKLSDSDVCAIKWLASLGVRHKEIADHFGISRGHVSHIIMGLYRSDSTCPALEKAS